MPKKALCVSKDKKWCEERARIHNQIYEDAKKLQKDNKGRIPGSKGYMGLYSGVLKRGKVDVYVNKKGGYVVR